MCLKPLLSSSFGGCRCDAVATSYKRRRPQLLVNRVLSTGAVCAATNRDNTWKGKMCTLPNKLPIGSFRFEQFFSTFGAFWSSFSMLKFKIQLKFWFCLLVPVDSLSNEFGGFGRDATGVQKIFLPSCRAVCAFPSHVHVEGIAHVPWYEQQRWCDWNGGYDAVSLFTSYTMCIWALLSIPL